MTGRSIIAVRLARLRAELERTGPNAPALVSALDGVGGTLEQLGAQCGDDAIALRLGASRAVATSYVLATTHLREAGVGTELCEDVLRQGCIRLSNDLADVVRDLASAGHAAGGT